MNDQELGAVLRAVRHHLGLRQIDVAGRAGISASVIGNLERGRADRVSVRALRTVARVLEVRLSWDLGARAVDFARLRDADHAALAEAIMAALAGFGWLTIAETSFNHYGDRGRIDVLAFHPARRVLLVIEVKTVLADAQTTLGSLDVKTRNARRIAMAHGWDPAIIVPWFVIADTSTNRRRIAAHQRLFARYALRGSSASGWLRDPATDVTGGLAFLSVPRSNRRDARRPGRVRVRAPQSAKSTRDVA